MPQHRGLLFCLSLLLLSPLGQTAAAPNSLASVPRTQLRSSEGASPCGSIYPGYQLLPTTILSGIDLATLQEAPLDVCLSACSVSATCQGVTRFETLQTCLLLSNVSDSHPFLKSDSWVACGSRSSTSTPAQPPTSDCGAQLPGYLLQPDTDYPGLTALTLPNSTSSSCAAACSQQPDCAAFVSDESQQLCFLKTVLTQAVPSPGVDTWVPCGGDGGGGGGISSVPTPPCGASLIGFQLYPHGNLAGTTYHRSSPTSPARCGATCQSNPTCAGFVHRPSSTCYLISKIYSITASPSSAAYVLCRRVPPEGQVASSYLSLQNAARHDLGLAPLRWNASIAATAAGWATWLGEQRNCSGIHGSHAGLGQNLAQGWGPGGVLSAAGAVGLWLGEKSSYSHARFPSGCSTGDWSDCGHYTQVVWGGTSQIGCASYTCPNTGAVHVCDYYPPGNVGDQYPY